MDNDSSDSDSSNNSDNDNSTFESYINDLAKQVQEYDSKTNDEKIQNIDEYNQIMNNISNYEEEIEKYKTKLSEIESKKPLKKKSIYTKNNFTDDMDSLQEIKNSIDSTSKDLSIDDLMDLYDKITKIQLRIVPYLENKKMEIIKM